MALIKLALASLWNRRGAAMLTVLGVAFSVTMLVGVEKVRRDARDAFANTLSGTDLIIGARSGAVQLLLYSVFRIGNATSNVSWQSVEAFKEHPRVAWTVPLSLGDSHRGFRVLGTSTEYFERYRYARTESLRFAEGQVFDDVYDAVLGAEVARRLGYALGDSIVVSHGTGAIAMREHDDKPFQVAGILAPTGTPVDRTVHVSLAGIEAMHIDWALGAPIPGRRVTAEQARTMDLTPKSVTALMVGLTSKVAVFQVQRDVNTYREEALLAIIPGVALQELWDLLGTAETALRVISVTVVISGLLGMLTAILASLESRRREMAVLRSVGARPRHIFGLFVVEAGGLAIAGSVLGMALLYTGILVSRPFVRDQLGLHLPVSWPETADLMLVSLVVVSGFVIGAFPALRAYRLSLADGLYMRL